MTENPTESAEDVATAIAYWQERIGKRDQAREAARIDDERRERLACEAVCAKVIHDALTIWEVDDETGGRGRAIQIIVDEVQTAIREAFKHD